MNLSSRARAALIAVAGLVTILLSAGAALLPALEPVSGATVVGALLLAAGVVETLAANLRRQVRELAMVAGAVTALAGLIFLFNPVAKFLPTISVVILWLLLRGLILTVASRRSRGSVRLWTMLSAAMDFLLGLLLLVGLSAATLVVAMFGPTPAMVASFAWVLALSFVVTGTLLLQVASCERDIAD